MTLATERLRQDFQVLKGLVFRPRAPKGGSDHHQSWLNAFYRGQAEHYDGFRERLLTGRRELAAALNLQRGARVVDLGGGTGSMAEFLGEKLALCSRYTIVDLCTPLLAIAQERIRKKGWTNVTTLEGDASAALSEEHGRVDVVIAAYSLSMMPSFAEVVAHGHRLLRPGGVFACVDFYMSGDAPMGEMVRHSRVQRMFWPKWFSFDRVFLGPERLATLQGAFPRGQLVETEAKVPYIPLIKVPVFRFVGIKD